jgi:hypothetical protein
LSIIYGVSFPKRFNNLREIGKLTEREKTETSAEKPGQLHASGLHPICQSNVCKIGNTLSHFFKAVIQMSPYQRVLLGLPHLK